VQTMTLTPGISRRNSGRTLAYRGVMRGPYSACGDACRCRARKRQREAVDAAIAEYRRLNPYASGDKLTVSGEVNRMIAAAINANPEWFWRGPDA
jgi:hypothetical protein